MVKAAWFRSYAANERPDKFDRIVQSWDTANKATELSPHPNPPPHAGEGREGVHDLGDQGQGSLSAACAGQAHEYPELKRAMRGLWRYGRADRGQGLGNPADSGIGAKGRGVAPEYLHELTVFPKGKHDDQVDSTAQMLDWLKQSGREPSGSFQPVKERALELRRQAEPGPPVRLRASPGIGAVQLLFGARRTVAADGTVEISEADAAPLLRAGG
jgi:hypothetical protein